MHMSHGRAEGPGSRRTQTARTHDSPKHSRNAFSRPCNSYLPVSYKCVPNQATSVCSSNADCAAGLNQTCFKNPSNSDFGYCLCIPLKRHAIGGITCNDVFGRCCNPNAPSVLFQCGTPLTAAKPGVSNLMCLPSSATCGCANGSYYQQDIGCVATPPNIGATCDLL